MPFRFAIVVLACAGLTGCGSDRGAGSAPVGVTSQVMAEVAELLGAYAGSSKTPPSKPADFKRYEPMFSDATRYLVNGEIAYQWGAILKPGSTAVLAYPKAAGEQGGPILLQDGTVKQMTAAEFAAAPKAGAK